MRAINSFFAPKSVAVIGATEKEGSVGKTLVSNLIEGKFKGDIYPINPKRETVLGLKCYADIADIEASIDLVVIITPAKTVPALIKKCSQKMIPAAVVISAGFSELGKEGEALEQQIIEYASETGMRVIGPNCLGVMNPLTNLNATFAADMALKGNIGFISQSGAMCTAVLDWSLQEEIGFSSFISIGAMADVDWGDLILKMGDDPDTSAILIYMESIGNASSFVSAARKVAPKKPIIVIKAGVTEAAAAAAASHTGSLAGSDDVFDVTMKQAGVVRVHSIEDLFDMALVLSKQPIPQGPNLTIVTNAGGPGVLATDATIQADLSMTELQKETIDKLSDFLPEAWSHANPVDILGDAGPSKYLDSIAVLENDKETDGIVIVLSPQAMTAPTETAKLIVAKVKEFSKPIYASWMGGKAVEEGVRVLNRAGIPTFHHPDRACRAMGKMWEYQNLKNTLQSKESSILKTSFDQQAFEKTEAIIKKARDEKRSLLTEFESKAVLENYSIPVVITRIAESPDSAAEEAEKMGFPVVVKLHSETITHKSDVGGVKLNLNSAAEVRDAYNDILASVTKLKGKEHFQGVTVQQMISIKGHEIILGSHVDPQMGPVLLFGTGGKYVEVLKDSALALPPLNLQLIRNRFEKTKIFELLKGVRDEQSVDIAHLESILMNFSKMITNHHDFLECDINPLIASPEGIISLDARLILSDDDHKRPPMPFEK